MTRRVPREERSEPGLYEVERLAALRSYEVLDTPVEASFDALTGLVAQLLDVPIALVSLVDAERQWFKSRHGLAVSETPRDVAFCDHVVRDEAPLVVTDARVDPRFAANPLVLGDPGVRFYAGVPLRDREGYVLGTLCAIDRAPRELTDRQREALACLAEQAVALLELRRVERHLRDERAALMAHKRFFDASSDVMCTVDRRSGVVQSANPAFTALLGWSVEALAAKPLRALVHPDDLARARDTAGVLLTGHGVSEMRFEARLRHREGWWVPIAWSVSLAADVLFASGRDLSVTRAKERALSESEARFTNLFESMVEGVVKQTRDGEIVACNPAALRILGLQPDRLLGKAELPPTWSASRPDGTPFAPDEYPAMEALRTGHPVSDVVMGVRRPTGETMWISASARPLFSAGEAAPYAVYTLFRDVTAERDEEARKERLAQHERLVTTGTLAAGVGHEINNPLAFVSASLEYAIDEMRTLEGPRYRGIIQSLLDARGGAERIRGIVQGLKALGRDSGPPTPTHVPDVVEMSVNMSMHELRQRASVVLDLTPVPPVLADEARLAQILVNLLINAGQAFYTNDPTRNRVVVRCAHHEDAVTITVSDNGPGIEPAVLARIFDPFFSTKAIGEGTGLGLSVSQNLAASLGGGLTCESTVGRGARFHLTLPVAQHTRPSQAAMPSVGRSTRGRMLVVDDEVALLKVIARGLSAHCDVVTESDPREALARLTAGEHFDVVLCDILMPHLTGADLYRITRERAPHMAERFVFMTGGVSRSGVAEFFAEVPNQCLEKPVTLQALRDIARFYTDAPRAERAVAASA